MDDRNENIKEAMPFFKYCIELYPDNAYGYHNLGYCYQQSGDKKRAIECYEKSLQLNPENEKAARRIKKLKKELADAQ
jgi:tetratricopeptide (TPR) repeat protein